MKEMSLDEILAKYPHDDIRVTVAAIKEALSNLSDEADHRKAAELREKIIDLYLVLKYERNQVSGYDENYVSDGEIRYGQGA